MSHLDAIVAELSAKLAFHEAAANKAMAEYDEHSETAVVLRDMLSRTKPQGEAVPSVPHVVMPAQTVQPVTVLHETSSTLEVKRTVVKDASGKCFDFLAARGAGGAAVSAIALHLYGDTNQAARKKADSLLRMMINNGDVERFGMGMFRASAKKVSNG